jgi:hypothetical protein
VQAEVKELRDWEVCTSSDQCGNGCCSKQYSHDGKYKCTPLGDSFVPESNGCVVSTQAPVGQKYQLQLIVDGEVEAKILDDIEYAFHNVYPRLASNYNPSADTNVTMRIHQFDIDAPAYADGEGVHLKLSLYQKNNTDTAGVTVHEIMHIVQRGWINVPGCLIEGFADYARKESQMDVLMNNQWSIPDGYQPGTNYRDAYGTATSFIIFLDENQIVSVPTLVGKFLDGSYSDTDEVWVGMAGATLDALWELYADVTG